MCLGARSGDKCAQIIGVVAALDEESCAPGVGYNWHRSALVIVSCKNKWSQSLNRQRGTIRHVDKASGSMWGQGQRASGCGFGEAVVYAKRSCLREEPSIISPPWKLRVTSRFEGGLVR